MTISEDQRLDGGAALADRQAFLAHYTHATTAELDALRARTASGPDRDDLDAFILARRREKKASLESLTVSADIFDKAALPAAAALPVFLTFLAGEKVLVDPWRTKVLTVAYLLGGALWLFCRWKSYQLAREAKVGAADLGKVD